MNTMNIFGVNESAATRALAQALWASGSRGKVFTGSGSCAAHVHKSHNAWVLHNTAWWGYGGAHNVVRDAAEMLAREAPEFGKPEGELTLVGHTLTCVSDEDDDDYHDPSPTEAAIWDVAGASHEAWREFQATRRIEKEAQEAGLPVAVFRLVRGASGFSGIGEMDREFAISFVEKFGDELALTAVETFSTEAHRLMGENTPERLGDPLCLAPYRSPNAGEYCVRDGWTVSEFGQEYLSERFRDEELAGMTGALMELLDHYGLERPIAVVYNG